MTLAAPLFFAGLCILLGGTIYSECVDRGTTDDPFGDRVDGDWPQLPEDMKVSSFHGRKD